MTSYIHKIKRETLRSCHGTGVDFDKICVFCSKCCVRIDKYVFIVVKIKCVDSGRISDICDKINFTIKLHIYYKTTHILPHLIDIYQNTHNILSEHTQIL